MLRSRSQSSARVTVLVNELSSDLVSKLEDPVIMRGYKHYLEIKKILFPGTGFEEIGHEDFAGYKAVSGEWTRVNFEKQVAENKTGSKITWKRSNIRGKTLGVVAGGFLYRIRVSSRARSYEEVYRKYFKQILKSFTIMGE